MGTLNLCLRARLVASVSSERARTRMCAWAGEGEARAKTQTLGKQRRELRRAEECSYGSSWPPDMHVL